jgi:single-strand DNA-binding protein
MGNLTRDPEVKYTPKGTAVCDLGLAVNETYKTQDGTMKETVTFIDVEVWGRTAENCKQYLAKGRPVFIEGSLKLEQWEDKETQKKRSKLKVRASRVQFLGGGQRDGASGGGGQRSSGSTAPEPGAGRPASGDRPPPPDDDDIPF